MELAESIREGLSRQEMCARFGVTKQALSKRLKRINVAVGKSALLSQGGMLLEHALDMRRRFVEISDRIRAAADWLEERLQAEGGRSTRA